MLNINQKVEIIIYNFLMISKQVLYIVFLQSILLQNIWAQTAIKSIPLPTGSGARALGQGGAFIGIADDATAASWNPAGLSWLERLEYSVVGSFLDTDQEYSVNPSLQKGLTIGDEDVSRWDLNFMSITYPFIFLDRKVVATLNYHQIYDFHMDLSIDLSARRFKEHFDFKSSGGIGTLSPGLSFLLHPKLSLGFTINLHDDEFYNSAGWRESTTAFAKNAFGRITTFSRSTTSSKDYRAVNANIGIMWDIWKEEEKRLTFGAVYHTPYTARFNEETKFIRRDFEQRNFSDSDDFNIEIYWPMSIGIGWNFRYSDSLSFAFDISWTDWSEWGKESRKSGTSAKIKSRPIGGGSEHDEIDDTVNLRFGAEYLWFKEESIIAFRGGLFYEPRPSLGSPASFDDIGNPVNPDGDPTEVWGFSLGTGYSTSRFSLDAAYQFRFVRDMEGNDIGLPGTDLDAVENMFITSLIVYF